MRLVTGDKCAGMLGALEKVFPGARYQRSTAHFYRNVLGRVPMTRRKAAARMPKAIHVQESRGACAKKGRGGGGVYHEWGKRRYLDMSKLEEMDRPNKTVGD